MKKQLSLLKDIYMYSDKKTYELNRIESLNNELHRLLSQYSTILARIEKLNSLIDSSNNEIQKFDNIIINNSKNHYYREVYKNKESIIENHIRECVKYYTFSDVIDLMVKSCLSHIKTRGLYTYTLVNIKSTYNSNKMDTFFKPLNQIMHFYKSNSNSYVFEFEEMPQKIIIDKIESFLSFLYSSSRKKQIIFQENMKNHKYDDIFLPEVVKHMDSFSF